MKRVLTMLLALAMMFTLFACGKKPADKTEDETPTEASTSATTAEMTEVPTEETAEIPTEAPTEESTAAPATKATAVPTTKATAAPTTKVIATPTTKATAAPTTKATKAPTTKATSAPTTKATAAPTTTPATEPEQKTKTVYLVSEIKDGDYKQTFTYDSNGVLTGICTENSRVEIKQVSKSTSIEVGASGELLSALLTSGSEEGEIKCTYDENGQLTEINEVSKSGYGWENIYWFFKYDQSRRPIQRVRKLYTMGGSMSTTTDYIRDEDGLLVGWEKYGEGQPSEEVEIKYDSQGRIAEMVSSGNTIYLFTYSENEMIIQNTDSTTRIVLKYDDAGNPIKLNGPRAYYSEEINVTFDYIAVEVPLDSKVDAYSNYLVQEELLDNGFYQDF